MTVDPPAAASPRPLNLLLAATSLLGAWLLFQVQPMVAKRLLPWYGGGTAVWTTAMLFFQIGLLGGYLYAHLLVSRLAPARQIRVHAALLFAAAALVAAIPVVPTAAWQPASGDDPAARILATLAACVGLPYLALAATAPLVQAWYARANSGATPYRLYALSNLGSLAALVSYPLVVEPAVGVARQGVAWSALFVVFAAACASSGALAVRRRPAAEPGESPTASDAAPLTPGRSRRLEQFFWVALPACASVNLLAITAHLCMDVASLPLLWILPMAAYLLSFIFTFESDRWYGRWFWLAVLAASSYAVVYTWYHPDEGWYLTGLVAHVVLVLAIGMVCHGEAVRLRPPAARLTAFYLSIAAGGALGGVLAAVVAPRALADVYELPLGILAAWLLALAVLVTDRQSRFYDGKAFAPLLGMVALTIVLVVAMATFFVRKRASSIALARNFYGTLKVRELDADNPALAHYKLMNGFISHGVQFRAEENRRFPSQYYHLQSGVGLVLAMHAGPQRVGVVGLGVGTLAAYANAGDSYRFYEINPQVIEFADRYFTFLSDARQRSAEIAVVSGDARLMLAAEEPQQFDVLVLDAFSSDAIPTHLLTREAFEIYLRHLREPDGVLAVHISNRNLDLAPVVKAAADYFELEGREVDADKDPTPAGSLSRWLLLYRPGARVAERALGYPLAEASDGAPAVEWTDDFNTILELLYLRAP